MNDALQIVEQILPYFQPEYTVTMKMIDSMTDYRDVPIILNSVNMEDTYEGDFTERRVIEYTLEFTMKIYFFGPVYTGEVIKNVIERTYIGDGNKTFTSSTIDSSGLIKEVKHYEPAFQEISNRVLDLNIITFPSAINSKISVGDEIFGLEGQVGTVLVNSIAEDRLSLVASQALYVSDKTTLKLWVSGQPGDTFVVAENVTFYDDGTVSTFAEDKVTDAS